MATRPRRFPRWRSARCAPPVAPVPVCRKLRGWSMRRSWLLRRGQRAPHHRRRPDRRDWPARDPRRARSPLGSDDGARPTIHGASGRHRPRGCVPRGLLGDRATAQRVPPPRPHRASARNCLPNGIAPPRFRADGPRSPAADARDPARRADRGRRQLTAIRTLVAATPRRPAPPAELQQRPRPLPRDHQHRSARRSCSRFRSG